MSYGGGKKGLRGYVTWEKINPQGGERISLPITVKDTETFCLEKGKNGPKFAVGKVAGESGKRSSFGPEEEGKGCS